MPRWRTGWPLAGLALMVGQACSGGQQTLDQTSTTSPFAITAPPIVLTTSSTSTSVAEAVVFSTSTPDHPWFATAIEHRGGIGERFTYACPGGGPAAVVWGSDIYTDDSSVCTAAVHSGAITLLEGGEVVIEIREGQSSYRATTANGITTEPWDAWDGSFVIIEP